LVVSIIDIMHGRITDRRRYPVPMCRFEPHLAPWALDAWTAAIGDQVEAACGLGRFAQALGVAPAADVARLEHASAWSLGVPSLVPLSDPLQALAARLGIWHPSAPVLKPGRPDMGLLVHAHRVLWVGQRQAGKPRSTELPSPALPRDPDGTPCLAPSPRDVLRLGASMDQVLGSTGSSLDQVLVGSAWLVWSIESTAPLPDGNGELALHAASAWLCHAAGMRSTVLDLHASLDQEAHRRCRVDLAGSGATAAWCAHLWRTVRHACDEGLVRLASLARARSAIVERAAAMRAPRHPCELAEHLMASPIVDVRTVERILGLTFAAANDLVERCVAAGILREVTGRRRGRIYCCDESANALGDVTSALGQASVLGGAA
jgi:hypothetical protein